jgi:hypothetical protein
MHLTRFFPTLSADEAQAQRDRLHKQSAATVPHRVPHAAPGRPRVQLDASKFLAAAVESGSVTESESLPTPAKRAKYVNWFASPFIHDILAAYIQCDHSAKKTVHYLQRTYPRLPTELEPRFSQLHESTLRSWYKEKELLPRFQEILDEQKLIPKRGQPRSSPLSIYPKIEAEGKRVLTSLSFCRDRSNTDYVNTSIRGQHPSFRSRSKRTS